MAIEESKGTGGEVQEPVIVCSGVADTAKQLQGKVKGDQEKKEGDQEKEGEQKKETKKRKAYASRSDVWESYAKIKIGDELKKAKCKFCNRELLCDTKRNGPQRGRHWEILEAMLGSMVKGHDKVLTITVDNASANNGAVNYMRKALNSSECSIAEGKYLHMRCATHITNLIVTDSLKEVDVSVSRIRAAIKFIKNSTSRLDKFKKCAELAKVDTTAFLRLDVCTRWNLTYLMLHSAIVYEKAFPRYEEEDPYYALELGAKKGPEVIEPEDWVSAKKMVDFLKHFYDITLHVSATQHVTSNIFFHEIAKLLLSIQEWCSSDDKIKKDMGNRMLKKYCKYWGNPKNMNMLIFICVVLDPRYKLSNYVEVDILVMFGDKLGNELWNSVDTCFHDLFNGYKKMYGPSDKAPQSVVSEQPTERSRLFMKAVIAEKMKSTSGAIGTCKTEDEKYLAEENEEDHKDFDILQWWKFNSARFPILSRLAHDILAIPISTVASESAFSAGGRVLDDFRSSLTPSMVECLICTQDWLRSFPPTSIEEDPEKLAQIKQDLDVSCGMLNLVGR